MSRVGRILLVDDDVALAVSLQEVLESKNYEVTLAHHGEAALERLQDAGPYDVMLTDFQMPRIGGFELLEEVRKSYPLVPVIIMTAYGTMDRAIEATKRGAFDYVLKPCKMPRLLDMLGEAVGLRRGRSAELVASGSDRDTLVGQSEPLQAIFKEIGRLASATIPVMILGETGTGKELVARALHRHSDRVRMPFVAVNCAAIPDTLIESELFGHERGAFTNAVAQRLGRFEEAHGGTLFLDEIGDLPPQTQVKLLRVLEQRCVRRIGGKQDIEVNVRVISATHCDIPAMVRAAVFREDLHFRLNAAVITLPPLRDRKGDIRLLVAHFLEKLSAECDVSCPKIEEQALKYLTHFSWPGNVRQLENVIKRAFLSSHVGVITERAIAKVLTAPFEGALPSDSDMVSATMSLEALVRHRMDAEAVKPTDGVLSSLVQDLEREVYRQAWERSHGNQSRVATLLGLSRATVHEKLERYGLLLKDG